jgi:hypothetical protein
MNYVVRFIYVQILNHKSWWEMNMNQYEVDRWIKKQEAKMIQVKGA